MDFFALTQAILLGAVQGITELLPISSSAHLLLAPWFLGWKDQGLSFTVALHLGTTLAILFYFRRDWLGLAASLLPILKRPEQYHSTYYDTKMLWFIGLATLPGVVAGMFMRDIADSLLRDPSIAAASLFVFGLLLWRADSVGARIKNMRQVALVSALIIGFAQALAIIPGVSRSGITITAGLFLGFTREAAARFSFLLAAPLILGAGLVEVPQMLQEGVGLAFWLGIISAAIFGWLALKFLFTHIQHGNFKIFVWYRIALAAVIVLTIILR